MFNGEKLFSYLQEKGISYREFGELVGVSGAFISYLVNCKKQPSLILVERIAAEIGCSVDNLIYKR